MERGRSQHATLSVFGFSVGCGLAGLIIRLLLLPTGLAGRTTNLMLVEGDLGGYLIRLFLFAFLAGIAGAVIAWVHNEFAKRS